MPIQKQTGYHKSTIFIGLLLIIMRGVYHLIIAYIGLARVLPARNNFFPWKFILKNLSPTFLLYATTTSYIPNFNFLLKVKQLRLFFLQVSQDNSLNIQKKIILVASAGYRETIINNVGNYQNSKLKVGYVLPQGAKGISIIVNIIGSPTQL